METETTTAVVPIQCKKQGCKKYLSPEEILQCERERILPLCAEHKEWFKNELKRCAPLFNKMNL